MRKFLVPYFSAVFLLQNSFAQVSTDTLVGLSIHVADARTGEALPFVSVRLFQYDQQLFYYSTDFEGTVKMNNLTFARYDVRLKFDGYVDLDTMIYITESKSSLHFLLQPLIESYEPVDVVTYQIPLLNPSGAINGGTVTRDTVFYPLVQGYWYHSSSNTNLFESSVTYYEPHLAHAVTSAVGYYHDPLYCQHKHEAPWNYLDSIHKQRSLVELIIFERNGKKGISTKDGEIVAEPIYDEIRMMLEIEVYRFIVQKDDKFGLMNGLGEWVIPCEYDGLYTNRVQFNCRHSKHLILTKKNGKLGLITSSGTVLAPAVYDHLDFVDDAATCPARPHVRRVMDNGKYGCINQTGQVIVPVIYDSIGVFKYASFALLTLNGKFGAIDKSGQIVLEPAYEKIVIYEFSDELVAFKNGKAGVISDSGKVVVDFLYEDIIPEYFLEHVYLIMQNKKWGLLDASGQVITEPIYEELKVFEDYGAHVLFRQNNKWGLLTDSGYVVQPAKFDEIEVIGDARYAYRIGSKWGFIFDDAKQISTPLYDEIFFADYNFYTVKKGSYYGVCNERGEVIVKPQFLKPIDLYDLESLGYSNFEKDGKYGMVDFSGKIICKPIYDELIYFADYSHTETTVTTVYRDGKPVLLNSKGVEIIGPYYDYFYNPEFAPDFYVVIRDEKEGIVNRYGKQVCEPIYDEVVSAPVFYQNDSAYNYFVVKKGNACGMMDELGKFHIPLSYESITDFNDTLVSVSKDSKSALMTHQGKLVLDFVPFHFRFISGKVLVVSNDQYKYGMISFKGDMLGPIIYSNIEVLQAGTLFKIFDGTQEGLMNEKGEVILAPVYQNIKYYAPNFFAIKKDDLYGFADSTGKLTVDYTYEKVKDVRGNYVVIRSNDKFGVVTKQGEEIIPAVYDQEISLWDILNKGSMSYSSYGKYGLINSNLEIVLAPVYSNPIRNLKGSAVQIVQRNGLYGLLDSTYQEIIPCIYPKLETLYSNTFLVEIDGRSGVIAKSNQWIIQCEYDFIGTFFCGDEGTEIKGYYTIQNGFISVYDATGIKLTNFVYDQVKQQFNPITGTYYHIVQRNQKWYRIEGSLTEVECKPNP